MVEYRWTMGGGRVDYGWRTLPFYDNFIPDFEPVSGKGIMIKVGIVRKGNRMVYVKISLFKNLILNILFTILINFKAKSKFIFESCKAYSKKY
jgi:hypothetical protein